MRVSSRFVVYGTTVGSRLNENSKHWRWWWSRADVFKIHTRRVEVRPRAGEQTNHLHVHTYVNETS